MWALSGRERGKGRGQGKGDREEGKGNEKMEKMGGRGRKSVSGNYKQ